MIIQNHDRELFHGECPYTGNPCKIWMCRFCPVELRERRWMKRKEKRMRAIDADKLNAFIGDERATLLLTLWRLEE